MDDAERAFRDALHRVDSVKIPVPSVEPGEVRSTRGRGLVLGRWLAAVAAIAVVAGMGTWVLTVRGQPVTAVPAAPASVAVPVKLTGTTWMAVDLYGKPTKPAPEKVPFLEFGADSGFSGGDPCNQFQGTYRLVGNELNLGTFAKTEIGCNVSQQQQFDKALGSTRRVSRDGDILELLDSAGGVLARFRSSGAYTTPGPTPSSTTVTITPTPTPTSTTINRPAPAVWIRIRNASNVDFTDVYALFPNGEKMHYGPIAAGSVSKYASVLKAYGYSYLKVSTPDKSYVYQPIDYVGESELPDGHYGYVVDIVDSRIELTLERS